MIICCEVVERAHAELLPSPFLSCVIDDCMGRRGRDRGRRALQPLRHSGDSVRKRCGQPRRAQDAGLRRANRRPRKELHEALVSNFEHAELLRLRLLNKAPKYGNDVEWVDAIAFDWAKDFAERLSRYTNVRGGPYQMGLYTVSAHVPMGQNVGATPDGRFAKDPLADGGMSPVYGRDSHGPTAVLKSVSRVKSEYGSNGTLLNMKFLPSLFRTELGVSKFVRLLRAFIELKDYPRAV